MFNAKESDSEHRLNIKINNLLKQKTAALSQECQSIRMKTNIESH